MVTVISIEDAAGQLEELIDAATRREPVIITREGRSVAKLVSDDAGSIRPCAASVLDRFDSFVKIGLKLGYKRIDRDLLHQREVAPVRGTRG